MIRFISTRGACPAVGASAALLAGLAPDGGLYVPERLPELEAAALKPGLSFPSRAALALAPFFEGDPLEGELGRLCEEAFDFPLPLAAPDGEREPLRILELFHGPTAAFKDFGARFLARAMERLGGRAADPLAASAAASSCGGPLTILVATSGDTGGAVAAAFHRRPGLAVRVLFPQGGVSPRQKRQLTCWGDNVSSYEVRGSFDDCQRLVKAAFRDESLARRYRLSSANSINLGRLLPQMAYYVHASALYRAERGVPPSLVIPSGNLGNALGAFWARAMGAPIDRIVMASNANRALPDYFSEGAYRPRPSVPTIANAMDVGDPSNMERLRALYPGFEALRAGAAAYSVGDQELRAQIKRRWERSGYLICPHTAAADRVYEAHLAGRAAIVVATAHPAKFETVVEPIIGSAAPVPPALRALLEAPSVYEMIGPELSDLFPG